MALFYHPFNEFPFSSDDYIIIEKTISLLENMFLNCSNLCTKITESLVIHVMTALLICTGSFYYFHGFVTFFENSILAPIMALVFIACAIKIANASCKLAVAVVIFTLYGIIATIIALCVAFYCMFWAHPFLCIIDFFIAFGNLDCDGHY